MFNKSYMNETGNEQMNQQTSWSWQNLSSVNQNLQGSGTPDPPPLGGLAVPSWAHAPGLADSSQQTGLHSDTCLLQSRPDANTFGLPGDGHCSSTLPGGCISS